MRDIEQTEAALNGNVVFVTMELSKSSWLLASQASPSGKHRRTSWTEAMPRAFWRYFNAFGHASKATAEEVQIILGYEAGYDGFWLHRRLTAEGVTCWVMDPGSLQVDRRARRAKTDRLDAAMLLRALIAWCRGDQSACNMVQVPSIGSCPRMWCSNGVAEQGQLLNQAARGGKLTVRSSLSGAIVSSVM